MLTEDELKQMESEIDFTLKLDLIDIRALIAEVRRLNTAYARFLKDFQVDLEHIRDYDKFATEIEVVDIFEPERFASK